MGSSLLQAPLWCIERTDPGRYVVPRLAEGRWLRIIDHRHRFFRTRYPCQETTFATRVCAVKPPNQRLPANAAIALLFQVEHHWRDVGEPLSLAENCARRPDHVSR
jgi:hypothetical protein